MPRVIDEADIPNPPRFWWLKRLAVAYTLFITAMVGTWFAWDKIAERRFNAEVARLHGLGQMVFAADFAALPRVPSDQNAATLYLQTFNFRSTPAYDDIESNLNLDLRLTDNQRKELRSLPVDFAGQLQLARQARQRSRADWGRTYSTPMVNGGVGFLNGPRALTNLLGYTVTAHHLDANDAEAVECLRDMLHLARMMDADGHSLVSHLVGIGMNARACSAIDEVAMELAMDEQRPPQRLASTQPTTQPSRPATRQQVQGLIAQLLDESLFREGFIQAQQGEQAIVLDTINWMATSPSSSAPRSIAGMGAPNVPPVSLLMMRPMFRMSGVRMSQRLSMRADAAKESILPAMRLKLPDTEREFMGQSPVKAASRVLERTMEPGGVMAFEWQARQLATRRAAAIKLALRLYQLDHAGRLPDKLDALVPAYLPSVPLDPFAADGRPMKFVASAILEDFETPLIYSVGEDEKDNGASTRPDARSAGRTLVSVFASPWLREDLVFPLKSPPPTDPPPPPPPDVVMPEPATTEPSP